MCEIKIDNKNRSILLDGDEIGFSSAEFDLFTILAENQNKIVTRDEIYKRLFDAEYDGLDRLVDIRVSRLRKRLINHGKNPNRIKSIRSEGYLFATD